MSDSSPRIHALDMRSFDEWPPDVRALLDGCSLDLKIGLTVSLVTVDAKGLARTTLLSAGDLYAPDARTVCFLLWPQSRAARLLRDAPRTRACLAFVHDAAFYQVQLGVEALPVEGDLAGFMASIESAERQQVGYARLTSGIAFALEDDEKAAVLERWRLQIDRLRRAVSARPSAPRT